MKVGWMKSPPWWTIKARLIPKTPACVTLDGPVVGAAAFTWLQDTIIRSTEYWRALLGATILVLVIAFPQGLAGGSMALFAKIRGVRAAPGARR